MTEAEFAICIDRIKRKEKEGLKEIYQEYIAFIYSIIYEKLQNRENAEDITSDFFIKLWEKAALYKPGNGHKGWMATIARNMAVDFLRKNRREELTDFTDGENEETDHKKTVQKLYRNAESPVEKEAVGNLTWQTALLSLKEPERGILNLKIMGDLTFKEIASILHMPLGTVTWKYRESIKKLRRCGYEKQAGK